MYAIWQEMTENENKLIAIFEERMHDLIKLCNDKERTIKDMEATLNRKAEEILQANQKIESWHAKYKNLLTARRLAEDEGEFQNARKRLNKLVREVDTCIALLNE